MKTTFCYDHYFLYDELRDSLSRLQTEHPGLIRISTLAQTPELRSVLLAEITDFSSGSPEEKPAVYIDGNQHAGEVTSSMVVLHLADALVNGAGDPEIAELLRQRTFYIIPRVAADGAERYLTTPEEPRSSPLLHPEDRPLPGLHPADVDGDGAVRFMRIKSPYGTWKVSPVDSRLMVRRRAHETEGEFYNVYREGLIRDYDGVHIQPAPPTCGLDFNRNFPIGWEHDRWQTTGNYPLSQPETKCLADFVLSHKNIASVLTYHTAGGYFIYPPQFPTDKATYEADRKMFLRRGTLGTEVTGYPVMNLFREFWPKDAAPGYGAFDDWCYQAQGLPAFTVECWNLNTRAGVPNAYPMNSFTGLKEDRKAEQETKQVLDWIDKNLGSDTFRPWAEFDHPQLGSVEIGGIDHKFVTQNCPFAFLPQEVEKHTRFVLQDAWSLPRLSLDQVTCTAVGEGQYRVRAVIGNRGFLPTDLTRQGRRLGKKHPVRITLTGGKLLAGKRETVVDHLEGFSGYRTGHIGFIGGIVTLGKESCQGVVEWLVSAGKGTVLELLCQCETAGSVQTSITL